MYSNLSTQFGANSNSWPILWHLNLCARIGRTKYKKRITVITRTDEAPTHKTGTPPFGTQNKATLWSKIK